MWQGDREKGAGDGRDRSHDVEYIWRPAYDDRFYLFSNDRFRWIAARNVVEKYLLP